MSFQFISNKNQRYKVTETENGSTCFGWYLHPSSGAPKLYLQHLVFVTPLLLPAAIVEELNLVPRVPTLPR